VVLERKVNEKTKELSDKNDEILTQSRALQESNLTKDKLFSIISHDLRGPIGQLKQTLDMVKSGSISLAELGELIPHLDENIGSAFSLTDNLLYWAKSQMDGIQVHRVLFDIMEIADENYHLFKLNTDNKHIELVNNINKSIAVYGDRDMIKLVLRNLIGNATKFTPVNGKITLGYSTKPGFVEVYVEDTGGGMSAEDIAKIFRRENFHKDGTSGEKGSGLGLSLCQDFIEKNGGKLTIQSQLGKGSKISFWLRGDDKISAVK
jgi:signal transduction histidine kinase